MTPKGRKYTIIIGTIVILMMLGAQIAPDRMEGAEAVGSWLGLVFWGLAFALFAYSVWEILRDFFRKND